MKLTLVNPPRTDIDRSEIAPPLGLLRLAAAGRSVDVTTNISDLNLHFHLDDDLAVAESFYYRATQLLLEQESDVYCFTSMAVDSHVAIHLARLLKEERPEAVTVLGGTHFSSTADAVIDQFPWIDFVVAGEGENFIRDLPSSIENSWARRVIKGSPPIDTVTGNLPFEILDLEAYFSVNENRSLDFESGRGCRFKCAFCYSPNHYDGFRNFAIDSTITGLARAYDLGFKNVFFVEDNFLNDPARALDLCKELEKSNLGLAWQAYATFPQLTSEIIRAMGRAGCTGVFAGIDAIGKESRRIHKKAFVREVDILRDRIQECVDHGVMPTCAFLLSPPSYPGGGDIEETLYFALAARNAGAQVRLNTLTLYNQTGSFSANRRPPEYDEFKVRLMLDVPEVVERNPYAETSPELFPFHSRYVSSKEWHPFVSTVHALYTLFDAYPATIQSLWNSGQMTPLGIAGKMLDNTGPLLNIPKSARRDAQLLAAISVLEAAASTKRDAQPILELESERFLVFN